MTFVPFATATIDAQYSGERLLNYFLRAVPTGGTSPAVLIGRSGLLQKAALGVGTVRAIAKMNGDIYAVAGGKVWKFTPSTSALVSVGSVSDVEQTSIAASGAEVAIVAGGSYYICDGTTTATYSTGAVTSPQWVTFQDGYFLVSGTISGRADAFTISALDDGTAFNALEFAFAENAPDAIRGLISSHRRVYAFGSDTIEVFWNSGDASFPFTPSASETQEAGCQEGMTVAKADNAVYWVGTANIVYRSFGSSPEAISTPEIKEMLDSSTIERAFTFSDRGHEFYAIRRKDATTLCYDITTRLWCERSTGVGDEPWTATCSVVSDGVTYFGTDNGLIVVPDKDTFTDVGVVIEGEVISAPVVQQGRPFRINHVYLNAYGGGVYSGTPRIMMQVSRDGETWGVEKWRDLGSTGEYNKRISWHGLGAMRRGQLRLRVTDPVNRDLHGIAYG